MTPGHDDKRRWSDEREPSDPDAATQFAAHVLPKKGEPTRVVLDGRCPGCCGVMTSVHTGRGPLTQAEAFERITPDDREGATPETHSYRVIATQCGCCYEHPEAPENERGCGAPIALVVRWPRDRPDDVKLFSVEASAFERLEERALQETLTAQLSKVRNAAESWRTGLGGFLAVLTVVFFVQGATSFNDVASGWHWPLAVLLMSSAASALYGAYRAIRAAYGTPADEYVPGRGLVWQALRKHLPATTPRQIHDYDSVGAWQDALAGQSVTDLRHAKVATVLAATCFAAAAAVTWLAPAPGGSERLVVEARTGSVCGKTVTQRGDVLVVDGVREVALRDVVSVKPVPACPSQ